MTLSSKRCFNHPGRQVAIRCPECGRFYCRECASEFKDRFLCKTCLDAFVSGSAEKRSTLLKRLIPGLGFLFSLFLTWLIFIGLAQVIYTIPSYYHSGLISHEEKSK